MAIVLNAPGTLDPGTSLALLGCVPAEVRPAMRTVDFEGRLDDGPERERSLRYLMGMGKRVLQEIEAAACEKLDGAEGTTRLAFSDTPNYYTGQKGITVNRQHPSGSLGWPLAELLLPPACQFEDLKSAADEFAYRASSGSLRMVGFEDSESKSPRPAVFAAARDSSGLWVFARLLVTPFEIGQWAFGDRGQSEQEQSQGGAS